MQNFKLGGLPMPVNDKDASNKIYVDTLTEDRRRKLEANNAFTFDNGAYTAKGKIDMRGFKIENAENIENAFIRRNGGFDAQDHIYLKNKKLGGLRDPIADREAANKKYVDEENTKIKENTINKFTDGVNYAANANFNLNNFRLFGVPEPQREDETVNKKYVDDKTANLQPAAAGVDPAAIDKVKADLEKNQAFNTRNQKTFNARGNLNMKQKTIRNIPDPTDNTDAVNKGYVDEIREFFEDRIKDVEEEAKEAKAAADRASRAQPGGGPGNGNGPEFGDMKGRKLVNVGDPENPADGVNKKYVDAKTPFTKTNGYFTSSAKLDMDLKKLTNLDAPTASGDAVNKKYVDDSINNIDAAFLRRNGGFLAMDSIDMNTNRIKNVGAPLLHDDVTNKKYVDEKIMNESKAFIYPSHTGNTWAKTPINMSNHYIEDLGFIGQENDATPKNYVDGEIKKVDDKTENIKKDIINLRKEDQDRKGETDRIRVLINEKIKEIEEKEEIIKNDIEELKGLVEETKENKDMKGFKVVNVGNPEDAEDATNKKYVDNEINKIDQAFLKENGYYLAKNSINMGFNNIKNLPDPTEETDAAPKSYIDKTLKRINKTLTFLNEEDFFNQISDLLKNNPFSRQGDGSLKLLAPLDLERKRVFNGQPPKDRKDLVIKSYVDENFLSNEKESQIQNRVSFELRKEMQKLLSFSSFFIHGEAEGPIIGMDKIRDSNFRAPNFSAGNPVAADDNRNIIELTPVFFGKYDGGYNTYNNLTVRKLNNAPLVVLPFQGSVVNLTVYGKKKDVLIQGEEVVKVNLILKTRHGDVRQQSYTYTLFSRKENEREDVRCYEQKPYLNFFDCSTLIVRFDSSHENIERIFLTIGVQMYNERFDVYDRKVLPWA